MLSSRQRGLIGEHVALADQVHGVGVRHVESGFAWPVMGPGDVLVTGAAPIGIWAADCAPIFLVSTAGTIIGAHGGWRGLAAGVIDVAVEQVHAAGDRVGKALVGPLVHPCCYEFGASDAAAVAAGVHADPAAVAGVTTKGKAALDVPAAVRAGLAVHDIELDSVGPCTGCTDRWFSYRVHNDAGRHAVVAWSTDAWSTDGWSTEGESRNDR